jgi:hypothetical protein
MKVNKYLVVEKLQKLEKEKAWQREEIQKILARPVVDGDVIRTAELQIANLNNQITKAMQQRMSQNKFVILACVLSI